MQECLFSSISFTPFYSANAAEFTTQRASLSLYCYCSFTFCLFNSIDLLYWLLETRTFSAHAVWNVGCANRAKVVFHWQAEDTLYCCKILMVQIMHIIAMALVSSGKFQPTPKAFSCPVEFSSDSHVTNFTVMPTILNHSAVFCALNLYSICPVLHLTLFRKPN